MSSADLIAAMQAEQNEESYLPAVTVMLKHNLNILIIKFGCDIAG